MRKNQLYRLVDESQDVHRPLPIREEWAETRIASKPVKARRLVDDAETLDHWKPVTYGVSAAVGTEYASADNAMGLSHIALSDARAHCGTHSVRFDCPTNLPRLNKIAPGRIYAVPTAYRVVERENWEQWNMMSAWVWPEAPGMKTITLRMQLHNDGDHKVPDIYDREGAHNMTLKPNQWNRIVLEIPYLARDCVTGVGFEYDMVGHEPDAVDHVVFYIDELELLQVDCDLYEGWQPKSDRLVYSHSGYQPGAPKLALASGLAAQSFRLVELDTGRIVYEAPVVAAQTALGQFQVLDFTDWMQEGTYMLCAGDVYSRAFEIGADCWESSVWNVLSFFLALRCGYEVLGRHQACHSDLLLKHGDQAIVANGGWHDAADLAQSLPNTADGVIALLLLAQSLTAPRHARLRTRVLDEAKWGLDYVLKTRFGDGYRATYSSSSIWTDGIIGTGDDITTEAGYTAFVNFDCAYAEILGAELFAEIDENYARFCKKIAADDYRLGKLRWETIDAAGQRHYDLKGGQPFANCDTIDPQVCSAGAMAAAGLYTLTGQSVYQADAVRFANRLLSCQQQRFEPDKAPMIGFFWQDRDRDLAWHHYHLSYSQLPETALDTLCRTFPDAPEYMQWYGALTMSASYYRRLHRFSAPYGLIPAGLYHENEADYPPNKLQQHITEAEKDEYRRMVRAGQPLGNGWYVRCFPVWFSYRGNYNVLLSQAVAMNAAARLRADYDLYAAAQDQYQFIVGKNPFGQSTMVGEGYDYVQHYAVQPGQNAGSLTVGMETLGDADVPFWPQVNTAVYKEVWVCSATKWMWGMAGSFSSGRVYGCMAPGSGSVVFTHKKTGLRLCADVDAVTGYYEKELPAGIWKMEHAGRARTLTMITGRQLRLDGDLYDLTASAACQDDTVTLTVTVDSTAPMQIRLRWFNVEAAEQVLTLEPGVPQTLSGKLIDTACPFVALAQPCVCPEDRVEISDSRL